MQQKKATIKKKQRILSTFTFQADILTHIIIKFMSFLNINNKKFEQTKQCLQKIKKIWKIKFDGSKLNIVQIKRNKSAMKSSLYFNFLNIAVFLLIN